MSSRARYPNLALRSKSEIAKRISDSKLPYAKALELINDVLANYDSYWKDHATQSKPEEGKYVRSAAGTRLALLLRLIDRKILAKHDDMVPNFIFGGLRGRNHIQAVRHLLGRKRQRVLRGLDVTRFFEQVSEQRVFYFFYKKAGCSRDAARLLARLCCVPEGKKGSKESKTLARGFATSSRLSLWCNLDTFLRLDWEAKKELRGHEPRIAIYVDDIGITASRVSVERMNEVSVALENILKNFDKNQPLPLQERKSHTVQYDKRPQHLGLQLGRGSIGMGKKSRSKYDKVRNALSASKPGTDRKKLMQKRKAYVLYQKQIDKPN